MNESETLPFGLTNAELSEVKITYSSYSAKTGVGKAEISLSGSGYLRLLEGEVLDDPDPRSHEDTMSSSVIIRLLDVMEEEGFFNLNDLYPHTGVPTGTRIIELSLPDRSKKVILDQPAHCPPFERIAGAIKFAAGLATPTALQQRFFQRF